MTSINTEIYSHRLRKRALLFSEKKLLIARLTDSEQEKDLTSPVNCHGYGRTRHFCFFEHADWSANPLPIVPAAKALECAPETTQCAQVFQIAACNWRCWYCYVDFSLLAANHRLSQYFTPEQLIDMYLEEKKRPLVIDLSGGQPDIIPEWVAWTMEALEKRGLAEEVFLWSDDNLSNRYFWDFLSQEQRRYVASFRNYARVGCFKGYDESSFTFNTSASPELFHQQFEIFRDLLREGLDMYAYVTFTAIPHVGLSQAMEQFVDQLQDIHRNLPLRTVPLKIEIFTPTSRRVGQNQTQALLFQHNVHEAWCNELKKRFTEAERLLPICDVQIHVDRVNS